MYTELHPYMSSNESDKFDALFELGVPAMGTYFLILELQKNLPYKSDYKLQSYLVLDWFKNYNLDVHLAASVMNRPELFVREEHGIVYCPDTRKQLLKQHNKRKFASYAGKISAAKRKSSKSENLIG